AAAGRAKGAGGDGGGGEAEAELAEEAERLPERIRRAERARPAVGVARLRAVRGGDARRICRRRRVAVREPRSDVGAKAIVGVQEEQRADSRADVPPAAVDAERRGRAVGR